MNEHGYIRSVHTKLDTAVYRWKINDNYCGGVADAFYSAEGDGSSLFVEYKYLPKNKVPKRDATLIIPDCSALQIDWLGSRYDEDVNVAVILGSPLGGVVFTHKSWETGLNKGEFCRLAIPTSTIAEIIAAHCTRGLTDVNTNPSCYHGQRQSECRQAA